MRTFYRDPEVRLIEILNSIHAETVGWRAVHFHFHKLLEHYKSDYQSKIAVNIVSDFVKNGEGGIYVLQDQDIMVICKGVTKQLLDKMVFRLRYLFSDDPLAYNSEGEENPGFCTIHDLSVAWDFANDMAKKKLVNVSQADKHRVPKQYREELEAKENEGTPAGEMMSRGAGMASQIRPMTPARLSSIEKDIMAADLSRVMRRQPICAAIKHKKIRRVFDEFYINIAHLRRLIMANVDFLSNRWLFKYMTQLLDAKMLDLLAKRPADYFDTPISLNLNVETLLSDKFATFDAAIKPSIKVSIVIELQIADVFSDMEAFLVAKESVQKLGYRVCLDGVTNQSFIHIDREALGFDLCKVQWNADLVSDLSSPFNQKFKGAIERCGANRVILTRCDNMDALDYGHAFGVTLFQGRYLDSVVNPDAKIVN